MPKSKHPKLLTRAEFFNSKRRKTVLLELEGGAVYVQSIDSAQIEAAEKLKDAGDAMSTSAAIDLAIDVLLTVVVDAHMDPMFTDADRAELRLRPFEELNAIVTCASSGTGLDDAATDDAAPLVD